MQFLQKSAGCKPGAHQQRRSNGALGDGNHRVRTPSAITDISIGVKRQANAIAIRPGLCGQYRDLIRCADAAARQRLAQDFLFISELRSIICVLILAAPTCAKVRARRRDPLLRRRDNLFHFGDRVTALAVHDAHPRLLVRQSQRHKHRFAFVVRQERAAVDRLFDAHQMRDGRQGPRTRCPILSAFFAERAGALRTSVCCLVASSLLTHVKQAQPRQIVRSQQLLLHELAFHLAHLHCAHAAAVGRELARRVLLEAHQQLLGSGSG